MKTLNVQKIERSELLEKWGLKGTFIPYVELFIRSDRKGNVNFDKAPVYTWPEIQIEQKRRPVHFTLPPYPDYMSDDRMCKHEHITMSDCICECLDCGARNY